MTDAPLPPTTASDAELVAELRHYAGKTAFPNVEDRYNRAADRLDKLSAEVAAKDVLIREKLELIEVQFARATAAEAEAAGLRADLTKARVAIVLSLSFLARDLGTERLRPTAGDVIRKLAEADTAIRAALTPRMEADNAG